MADPPALPVAPNLYSDTQTRPTAGMRAAIAAAEVGDEQSFADPTVNALQERVADLLGHEAALFLPSGTMCNAIAVALHIRRRGDEYLLDRSAHPINWEAGAASVLFGAVLQPIDSPHGIFSGEQLRAAMRPDEDRYTPTARLVSVEQTTNMGGGRVWPLATVQEVLAVARERGMRTHMDGARLMNAVVASGIPARDYASGFDTAWIDFTKGLGAPVGACLAGSRELIEEAWRFKQMMGGAMRQAGVVAAAGLYALDHHVERLAEDHANARLLAEGLAEIPGFALDPDDVETNIVIAEVADALALQAELEAAGLHLQTLGATRLRFVTHLDVDRAGVEEALEIVRRTVAAPA